MFRISLQWLVAASFCLASGSSAAKEQSNIAHYPVTGANAVEIYNNIKKSSPRVARNATFAFTMIATKTDKKTASKEGTCRYTAFKTSAIYVFNVPKHQNPSNIRKGTRAKWSDFTNYLLRHEEGHRDIWRECFKAYDADAMTLRAKTCEALDKAREKAFTAIKRECLGRDEAYDAIFRKDVLRHPFVAEALKREKDRK
jgi:predicted secreted Zn-dependent protease